MVVRDGSRLAPEEKPVLDAGDEVWTLASPVDMEAVAALFSYQEREGWLAARNFFGEFSLNPDLPAMELAHAYGLYLAKTESRGTIADLVRKRLERRPVVGDRVTIGPLRLTIRRIEEGRIVQIGMKVLYS
jgi:cell volume regulation protein A